MLPDDNYLCEQGQGNLYVIRFVARRLMEGKSFGAELAEETMLAFADYLENSVIPQWDSDALGFLTHVSVVDDFDASLGYISRAAISQYICWKRRLPP